MHGDQEMAVRSDSHRPPPFLLCFLLISSVASSSPAAPAGDGLHPDYHPLQAFRRSADAAGALSSWAYDTDPCSGAWAGVACRGGRVTRLLLPGRRLRGPLGALTLLPYLRLLNLSRNHLSGEIPAAFLRLRRLRRVDLSNNLLSGSIPPEMGRLRRVINLRLEGNLFSGEIPSSLGSLGELIDFNVSGNRLLGRIPPSLSSFPISSFEGNRNLCGRPLVRPCSKRAARSSPPILIPASTEEGRHHRGDWKLVAASVGIAAASLSIAVVATVACWCAKKMRVAGGVGIEIDDHGGAKGRGRVGEQKSVVFFDGSEAFTVNDLMRGSAEMLGRGTVGTTYRVVMEGEEGMGLVVKRVRRTQKAAIMGKGKEEEKGGLAAAERLLAEVGGLRHPNVAGLRAYYHSDDELLLVYDYHRNGSLHSLLHESRGPGRSPLDWATRLKLALDAARGLAFLHGASASKLAHQHLTSSNVLVDDDGNARISDFALLQLLDPPPPSPPEWYPTAPELLGVPSAGGAASARRATQMSDVYGFGVVLLETLTGRAAAGGEADLAKWVQATVVKEKWKSSEVFDVELAGCREADDEMVALLQVALLCLAPAPAERPRMSVVSKMIEGIRERGCKRGREGSSPSLVDTSPLDSSTSTASEGNPTSAGT